MKRILQITLISVLNCFSISLIAQSGTLDRTFGDTGTVTTTFNRISNEAGAVAIQKDGKIVVTGGRGYSGVDSHFDIATSRYLPNGILDASFGVNGKVTETLGNGSDGDCIIVQPDDNILIGTTLYEGTSDGFGDFSFGLLRYLHNGSFDTSFGENGKVKTTLPGAYATLFCLALQSNNKIIAAGISNGKFALVRYLPDGKIDSTFGVNGTVLNNFETHDLSNCSMVLQKDGKILVAGTNYEDIIVGRFFENGSVDSSFGENGVIISNIGTGYPYPAIVRMTSDEHILVAATHDSLDNFKIILSRYDLDGQPDLSFGNNGMSGLDSVGLVKAMQISLDNKIYLINGFNEMLVRCNANGFIDSSFGTNGIAQPLHSDDSYIVLNDLAFQPDNKIVAVGYRNLFDPQYNSFFLVARYNNDIVLPITLLGFTAVKQNNSALIKWSVSKGSQNYFSVERSNDAIHFRTIATINGKVADAQLQQYSYIDNSPQTGINYYRLKLDDADGKISYSSIAKVDFTNSIQIKITPNPVHSVLSIDGLGNSDAKLSIVDMSGKIVGFATASSDNYNWNLQNLGRGVYYLIVYRQGEKIASLQFVKQ